MRWGQNDAPPKCHKTCQCTAAWEAPKGVNRQPVVALLNKGFVNVSSVGLVTFHGYFMFVVNSLWGVSISKYNDICSFCILLLSFSVFDDLAAVVKCMRLSLPGVKRCAYNPVSAPQQSTQFCESLCVTCARSEKNVAPPLRKKKRV